MPTLYGETPLLPTVHVHGYSRMVGCLLFTLICSRRFRFTCTEIYWDGGGVPLRKPSLPPLTWRIYKDMEFDSTQLIYLDTVSLDPDQYGENTTAVRFVWDGFVYTAFCFEGIIQFISAQRPDEPLYDGTYATLEQAMLKDSRKKGFNGDHAPLQGWIDALK